MATDNINLVVELNITQQTQATSNSLLNLPLILAKASSTPNDSFGTDRTKLYNSLSDVGVDWGTSSDEYKAVQALLSPTAVTPLKSFRIAKRNTAVATVKLIDFTTALTSATQKIKATINGVTLFDTPFNTDMATTLGALETKIEAVTGVASATVNLNTISVTATVDYSLDISVSVEGTPTITPIVSVTTAGRTIVDDYNAAQAEKNDFYYVLMVDKNNDGAEISLARYINTQNKQFGFASDNSDILTAVTTDIASKLKAQNLGRANILYHHDLATFPDFAYAGRCLAKDPGQGTWTNRQLVGVEVSNLNASQLSNALSKRANVYIQAGTKGITREGITFDNNFIYIIRDVDYLKQVMQNKLFDFLTENEKINYSDAGIQKAESEIHKVFEQLITENVILNSPAPVVTMPKAKDIPLSTKATALLNNVKFTVYMALGIHAIKIDGTIKI